MAMALITGWIPKPGKRTRGSGKTGGMTWKLHQEKLKGRQVFTNFQPVFEDDVLTYDMLRYTPEELRKAAIGASEVHLLLESRRTQRTEQIEISNTIAQLRKLRTDFHWDSQALHKVEKRLIDETDILIHCENYGCGDLDCREQSCGIETCGIFHYETYDRRSATYLGDFYLNGPKDFYHLFDSEQFVSDFITETEE